MSLTTFLPKWNRLAIAVAVASALSVSTMSQDAGAQAPDGAPLTKNEIAKIGRTLHVERCQDNPALEGLYLTYDKGTTRLTHTTTSSKMSIAKYPANGKYASALKKEAALGVLQYQTMYVTDIDNGNWYLCKHSDYWSAQHPMLHSTSRSPLQK